MGIEDRKQREFNRRENDILEAAFDLFSERGVENVTIEMIAELAEIGKGTIYKHFKSKNEIYANFVIGRGKEIYSQISKIDPALPVIEKLNKVFDLYIDFFLKKKKALYVFNKCEAMITPDGLSENVLQQMATLHRMKAEQLDSLFRQGIDDGLFIDTKPSILTMFVTGLFTGTMQQLLDNPQEDTADIVSTMGRVILNGILK